MSESGDRSAFLGRLAARLVGGVPPNLAHPAPVAGDAVPEPRPVALDEGLDIVDLFIRSVGQVAGTAERHAGGDVPVAALERVVEEHGVASAVVSAEPEVAGVGDVLAGLGIAVAPYSKEAGAAADLGVTSAVAGIAATGSVVVDSRVAGGRGASLLPRVHLCVLPAARILGAPGDLFRRHRPDPMPSALVLVTGPSRTGDIEQILTVGVHGPTAVHVIVTGA